MIDDELTMLFLKTALYAVASAAGILIWFGVLAWLADKMERRQRRGRRPKR